ncbi:MAG: galactose mutarotase [Bacteroidales bacterium]|nr:galactose mutarotase [Candidatus Hennigimonas equi]
MKKYLSILAGVCLLVSCCGKQDGLTKSGLDPQNFVDEYNGIPTALYTLTNGNGMEVCVTNFGGRIVSVMVPDRDGEFKDVVLGFDKVSDYFPKNHFSDFGAAIGRYANRIGGGKLVIDGNEYQLPLNDNRANCLHGGFGGWQYQAYEMVEADDTHVKLVMNSADGDNNFPGAVTAYVTYTLTEDNRLDISYEATTDAPTVINMTNHSYFNLSGDPANHSICEDRLFINSESYTPTDKLLIPTGEIATLEGTPLDFRLPQTIGDRIDNDFAALNFAGGYDHNWILNDTDELVPDVILSCEDTGITLTVFTNEPGIQVYTGNFLNGTLTGKNGVTYNRRTGICLESQHFPDSPNKPEWPTTVLRPGETYTSHCVFAFSVEK